MGDVALPAYISSLSATRDLIRQINGRQGDDGSAQLDPALAAFSDLYPTPRRPRHPGTQNADPSTQARRGRIPLSPGHPPTRQQPGTPALACLLRRTTHRGLARRSPMESSASFSLTRQFA
ncbi:hypothetical protein GWK47_007276 [Chionoecetes opilio]|uniref:Uncharacterized protein n=1 Tax=Chionoecetes opilio TaxID=41210 RepID=A0A8J5CSV8_CHIOP|nr:hypothetical protein GWK47_007276 [Chionoecetes opilio]